MKRIISVLLVLVMLASTVLVASAYVSMTKNKEINVKGATYYNYTVYGSVARNYADVNVIKFNAKDGLFPLAYATQAGKTNVLSTHVNAAIAEGYEVVGAINASFFDMTSGDPCAKLISDGKIVFDHTESTDTILTAFMEDGKPNLIPNADIDYALTLGSISIASDAIGIVNKDYSAKDFVSTNITNRFHYYDSDMGNLANSQQIGYEVLCEKLNGTELAVGKTLQGQVISVKYGYYGKTRVTNANQFVLFVKSTSSHYKTVSALSAGAAVSIKPTCSDSYAASILPRANSAIASTYWLVSNGNDLTDTQSEIIHSTSLARGWTAIGWDADGNYHFFVSEEYGLTLKDVADAMIAMGCTNVLRLDGGGSTTMWVDGQGLVENAASRPICDCILIVKKASVDVEKYGENLAKNRSYNVSVTNAPLVETAWGTNYSANLTDGLASNEFSFSEGTWFALCTSYNTVGQIGTVTIDLDKISIVKKLRLSLANQLDSGVNPPTSIVAYGSTDGKNYTKIGNLPTYNTDGYGYWTELDVKDVQLGSIKFEFTLNGAWAMLNEIEVYGEETDTAYTPGEIVQETFAPTQQNLASNRDYNIDVTNEPIIAPEYDNDYSAKLTDGIAEYTFGYSDGSWFAFYVDRNVANGKGVITIDFDKICDVTKLRLTFCSKLSFGVNSPAKVQAFGSQNGVDYTLIGDLPVRTDVDGCAYWSELDVANVKLGSIRFEITLNGAWAMINEIEVHGTETNQDYIPSQKEEDTSSQPEESQPEQSVPEQSIPEESVPEESQPEQSIPEQSVPEESQPDESDPEEEQKPIYSGEILYELSDDGSSYVVVGYKGNEIELYVPEMHNGLPVTAIGKSAFAGCAQFVKIELPQSVTAIDEKAFYHCDKLESVLLPKSVRTLGESAFAYCGSLKQIQLPEFLSVIGSFAFESSGLESIQIPKYVLVIGKNPFVSCQNLTDIKVDSDNKEYLSKNNCLINADSKALISGCVSSVIPADGSVTALGDFAFAGLKELYVVEIPEIILETGIYVFSVCTDLTDIYCGREAQPQGWDAKWNENCNATVHWGHKAPVQDEKPPQTSEIYLGDINGNGKIDMTDYILVKRTYFGTFTFDAKQNKAGDVNKNNKIDMTDYILLKRVYFGTYTLK